ncbi:response regulator transcription factor [Amphritea pacifica]|uniref:Response regulator transcription factor n=1 Tax=Amphritea pacifica TaxID=2811233 RepID=A0ABS2W4E0_9GAMM|nr:response regulator transcription factor [Amphritea pacifica]MBN0986581.1 response regulator transcription factor [Amphritea pacifica]MBN1008459.1 response regulator transcription factor [Amphritea pacifica]
MRVLVIEDDVRLVNELRNQLQKNGYVVDTSADGVNGVFLIREIPFDVIVLDLGLPKKSGLEVLREIRSEQIDTPVLILTARDSWQERVDGLKAGADDYLGKPFFMEELMARLEALIRRRHGQTSQQLEYAGVTLYLDTQVARSQDGDEFQLTGIEFRLLRYLLMNPDRLVSKTILSEHVYEEEQIRDSNVIEVYINRLRHRFGKQFIKTRRGQGYCLQTERSDP